MTLGQPHPVQTTHRATEATGQMLEALVETTDGQEKGRRRGDGSRRRVKGDQ